MSTVAKAILITLTVALILAQNYVLQEQGELIDELDKEVAELTPKASRAFDSLWLSVHEPTGTAYIRINEDVNLTYTFYNVCPIPSRRF